MLRGDGAYKDWLSLLKVATEIFNGYLKGYGRVPDEKELRESQLRGYMQDLLWSSIDNVL
jgi:hypothetical protein